jgi:excisionase family DNA binding protein
MQEFRINLSECQLNQLREQIFELISSEMNTIQKNCQTNCRYMNKKQACNYLQISNNTLDKWISKGLPFLRISGSLRFDRISIDQWLKNL